MTCTEGAQNGDRWIVREKYPVHNGRLDKTEGKTETSWAHLHFESLATKTVMLVVSDKTADRPARRMIR